MKKEVEADEEERGRTRDLDRLFCEVPVFNVRLFFSCFFFAFRPMLGWGGAVLRRTFECEGGGGVYPRNQESTAGLARADPL